MHRERKTLLWLAGLIAGLALYACTSQPAQTDGVRSENIRTHLSTLASDRMEGRAPGTLVPNAPSPLRCFHRLSRLILR